ncbi:MAG: Tyrosine-protein kinase ptk [Planctomycetota bacterium]
MSSAQIDSQLAQKLADDTTPGLDLVGFIRRRKSFVILFGLLGTGVGYMMLNREVPQYRAEAMVQVIHRQSDPRLRDMMAEKDLTDAVYVLKSPRTLSAAYKNHGLSSKSTLSGMPEDEAIATMAGMLSARSLSPSVISISVTGTNPEDIRDIANAASEEYVLAQKENYKDASEELKLILSRARDEFLEMLRNAEQEYAQFRETSNLSTDGDNPYRIRARSAEAKVASYELEKAELQAELEQLRDALAKGGAREAIILLVTNGRPNSERQGVASGSVDGVSEQLFPLYLEEARLAAELGPGHPRLKALQMKIQMTRRHLQEIAGVDAAGRAAQGAADGGEPAAGAPEEEPAQDFLSVYLQSLEQQLSIIQRQQEAVKALADSEDLLARKLMMEEIEDKNKKAEIERLSSLFNETTLSISEVQVNAGMGGVTAQVLSKARTGVKISPIMERFLGMGALLGALFGLGIGYLIEMADRSFRKPEDIIREFGVPIMGHIPFITEQRLKSAPEDSKFDRSAISVHLPRSRPAEAFRAIRTAVCFSALGGEHRVISVTSPAAGDGKSTLALNLAISLAQSGKKTVIIESDLRRPKVHKLTGADNKKGVVDVLRGNTSLDDVIQPTQVPDLNVIPCGPRPKDPAELLARPEYERLLEELRGRFDYVIVDTPPVLAVTDPAGVAARVDGVIVCMRLSRHTRELGKRTIESLRDIGATVAGIVINGVEERDAYGYGNYRYSDYRYYYKNYNYKYGYGRYGSYNSYTETEGSEYYSDDRAGQSRQQSSAITVEATDPASDEASESREKAD